jgi:putative tryptophan/tyrosine transport system substrate-binding protein
VIAATGTPAALAAKAATTTIPIVFETAGDPIKLGLIASLSRPGGNITGISQLSSELVSKRLGLLHDLIPTATIVGFFNNPTDPRAESQTMDTQEAARALGLKIHVLNASTEAEISTAFATLPELKAEHCWSVRANCSAGGPKGCLRSISIASTQRRGV